METSSKNRIIYFDEKQHKYTDDLKNPYTSVTTVIGKYENKFDSIEVAKACARIGRNPAHPKYLRYKGKSVSQILKEWENIKDTACENGSIKHNFLEQSIKLATGYNLNAGTTYINSRIYTIDDVIENPGFGELSLEWFVQTGIAKKYPVIYNDLVVLSKHGFRIYAEVGVFDVKYLISGLIDLFITNGKQFIIFDWKTNRSDIRFENGYFEKDIHGNLTTIFIQGNKVMLPPLSHLADSVGNHYSLQVSGYAWFAIKRGLEYLGSVIYQIREDEHDEVERIDKIAIPNLVTDAEKMFKHHSDNLNRKSQTLLFY